MIAETEASGTGLLDALTGAYTREAFSRRLVEEMDRARRYGQPLSLAVIDLDHFKSINDAFGHQRGDEILRGFAARTLKTLRTSDLLFRYGGDEFVLLMPGVARAQAEEATQRLLEAVRAEPFGEDPPLTLTLSIGGVGWSDALSTPEDFFRAADQRVYEAKRHGRNRAVWTDDDRPARLDFDAASRLLERDEPQAALRRFLDALPHKKHGVLRVAGKPGSGRSRFLDVAAKAAAVQGYAVLRLAGRPGYAHRAAAALLEACADEQGPWHALPSPLDDAAGFVEAAAAVIERGRRTGLLVVADGLDRIDEASRALINRLVLRLPQAALAYSADRDVGGLTGTGAAVQVTLAPLSPTGVHLWLRTVLHWEPPQEFSRWLHGQAQGLPGLLQRWVQALCAHEVLRADASTWVLAPDWQERALDMRVTLAPQPGKLPEPADMLIGRGAELHALKQHLADQPLVTLLGPGGMGKSRLALQLASEVAEAFPDGAWFVPLATVDTPEALARSVALALGLTLTGRGDARSVLLNDLRDRSLLLVLDNFEHLLEAAPVLQDLRHAAPGVRMIVTSRDRLGLPFETVLDLQGLDRGEPARHTAGPAERLFEQSAREVVRDFTLTPETAPSVARICDLVGGMPLAIRLAAAWTGSHGCTEIAEQLERNMALIAGREGSSGGAWGAIEYFWQQLSSSERRTVRQLASFAGGFDRKGAQAVAGASPFLLDALVAKAFLWRKDGGRYELHQLLRQFAHAQLETRPAELAAARLRHAQWHAAFGREAALHWLGPEEAAWLERVQRDHPNLVVALEWAVGAGRADIAQGLQAGLGEFWLQQDLFAEGRGWCERVLALDASAAQRAQVLMLKGLLGARQSVDFPTTRAALKEAVESARMCGDLKVEARSLGGLATALYDEDPPAAALEAAERACEAARRLGDPALEARSLRILGVLLAMSMADPARVDEVYERAAELSNRAGDLRALQTVHCHQGVLCRWRGQFEAARQHFEEAIAIGRRLGDRITLGTTLTNMGELHVALGDAAGALPWLEEGWHQFRLCNSLEGQAINRCYSGQALLRLEREKQGLRHLREALALARMTTTSRQLMVAVTLAEWLLARGDHRRAAMLADEVLAHPLHKAEYAPRARAVSEAAHARLGDAVSGTPAESIDAVLDDLLGA